MWSINLCQPAQVYIFNRHILNKQAPSWITNDYSLYSPSVINYNDLSMFTTRISTSGLKAVYDVYKHDYLSPQEVIMQGASESNNQAYSMYIVAVRPINNPSVSPSASPTPTTTPRSTGTPVPSASPGSTSYQPKAPYYAVFFYPWFRNPATDGGNWSGSQWVDQGHTPPTNWFSNYLPDVFNRGTFNPNEQLYSSNNKDVFYWQLSEMKKAHQTVAISSWWDSLTKLIKHFQIS